MAASTPDPVARQKRGEAALHKEVARQQDAHAAVARRGGADGEADEAEFRALRARERARQALQEAAELDAQAQRRLTVVPNDG